MTLNLYDIVALENQIERIAEENLGEIPEEMLKELVEAQTKSLDMIERLCKYVRHLELGIENCKAEKSRITEMQFKADNRIKSIKKYMTDYVDKAGKIIAGTFTLSIRKSEAVMKSESEELDKNFAELYRYEPFVDSKTSFHANKNEIKKLLNKGEKIDGAQLVQKKNLQIK